MNGVLVVDKPRGVTSHDVVTRAKRVLGGAKVGHLGTLDPAATGVLPLVINKATKFASWLDKGRKEYSVEMTLGIVTESYDSEGRVLSEADTSGITAHDIEKAFSELRGRILQVPPMFSAIKSAGRPLYKLARKGQTVERAPREVEIFSLEITRLSLPVVSFDVSCSRGTYVRSICHDAGRALGCGAYMSGLRRIRSGVFHLSEAIILTPDKAAMAGAIIPLGKALLRAVSPLRTVSLEEMAVEIEGSGEDFVVHSETDLTVGMRLRLPVEKGFSSFLEDGEMIRFTLDKRDIALARHISGDLCKIKWVFDAPIESGARKAQ